jgi:hypothetical protein
MELWKGAKHTETGGINDPLMDELCNILHTLSPDRVKLLIENVNTAAQYEDGKWLNRQN